MIRLPPECETGALPIELQAHKINSRAAKASSVAPWKEPQPRLVNRALPIRSGNWGTVLSVLSVSFCPKIGGRPENRTRNLRAQSVRLHLQASPPKSWFRAKASNLHLRFRRAALLHQPGTETHGQISPA